MSEAESTKGYVEEVKPKSRVWVLLAGLFAIGAYAAVLIPALAGEHLQSKSAGISILWSSIFFAVLWRYRSKSGWLGSIIGAVVAILIFFVAAFIGGFVRGASGI